MRSLVRPGPRRPGLVTVGSVVMGLEAGAGVVAMVSRSDCSVGGSEVSGAALRHVSRSCNDILVTNDDDPEEGGQQQEQHANVLLWMSSQLSLITPSALVIT